MPLYTFECPNCGAKEDVALRVTERDNPIECFWCDSPMMRVPTSAAVKFVGRDWTPKHYSKK